MVDASERVLVGPLSLGALHELLRQRMGGPVARPTLVRIHETSGGNPFFALELARALAGRELRPGEPMPVPATLGELTASRFERLGADAREVLLLVAALARPTIGIVTAAAGERAAPALETAVAEGLLESDGSRLRFVHPLLASVHYGSASPDERARAHLRLAEVVTDAEERGRHLAATTTEPDAQVAAALDEAAAAARARGAQGASAELSELAAGLTPHEESDAHSRRWFAAADAHYAAGDTPQACAILERLVEELPLGGSRVDALLRLSEYNDVYPVTFELAERALAEADGDAPRSAAAESLIALQWLVLRADLRKALDHQRRGVAFAEQAGDPVRLALNLAQTSHLESLTGDITPGLLERGVALEQETGLLLDYGPTFVLALRSMYQDRLSEARELLVRVAGTAFERGDEPHRAVTVFHLSELESRAGNYDAATAYADEALVLGRDLAWTPQSRQRCTPVRSLLRTPAGTQEARTLAEEGLELSTGGGGGAFMIQNASVLGFVELSVGDAAGAARRLRPLPPLLEQMGYGEPSVNRVLPNAIDALVQLGELDEARPLVDRLEQQGRRLDSPYGLSTAARCRGLLLSAEGDVDGAEREFEQALGHHERMPGVFERARTLSGARLRAATRKAEASCARGIAGGDCDLRVRGCAAVGCAGRAGARADRRPRGGRRRRALGDRAANRRPRRAGPLEQGGRGRALAEREDRGVEPLQGVRQARCPLADRARRPSALSKSRDFPGC